MCHGHGLKISAPVLDLCRVNSRKRLIHECMFACMKIVEWNDVLSEVTCTVSLVRNTTSTRSRRKPSTDSTRCDNHDHELALPSAEVTNMGECRYRMQY